MLTENRIEVPHDPNLDVSEIENYIKQKPTRSINLKFIHKKLYIHPWFHNLVNVEKLERQKEKRSLKNEKINQKRITKNKKPTERQGLRIKLKEWWLSAWEGPVIFDSVLMANSTKQLYLFLNNKGYFNSQVSDSVIHKGQKVEVIYKIKPSIPFKIKNIAYNIEDEALAPYIFADTSGSLIKRGNNYDVDVFQRERERITYNLTNRGYFYFEKEYISYSVDSFSTTHDMNISLDIKKLEKPVEGYQDSVIEQAHKQYYINDIYICTVVPSNKSGEINYDTLKINSSTNTYYILYKGKLHFKPALLINALYIQKGELYQSEKADFTYRRFSELRVFRSVTIEYKEVDGSDNQLNCYVLLSPLPKQDFSLESELTTNTGSTLGIAGNISLRNKNTLKGAEMLEIKMRGGLAVQQTINKSTEKNKTVLPFNTLQLGPEANFTIPRIPFFRFSKNANPKTIFTTSVNYQERNDFRRFLSLASLGFSWKETDKKTISINPMELTLVKVDLQQDFYDELYKSNNLILINSYTNHITPVIHFEFLYNDQNLQKRKSFGYLKYNLEFSGLGLRAINQALKSPVDANGSYTLFNIRYSHYIRSDIDYRYHRILSTHREVVFRIAGGMGYAFKNLPSLPFEKSFYSGGSNSIRAWYARTIGPGGFNTSQSQAFQQIGDILMEGNLEYRFNMFKLMNGAFFIDGGNIWIHKPDPERPNADFKLGEFYKQLALGTGFGLRADFSFFVVRLDVGIKMRDPTQPINEKIVIQHLFDRGWKTQYRQEHDNRNYHFAVLNFGIGYPF